MSKAVSFGVYGLGLGTGGFGAGYAGSSLSNGSKTIGETLKTVLGYKLVGESDKKKELYETIFKVHKNLIVSKTGISTDTDKEAGGKHLEKWCSEVIKNRLDTFSHEKAKLSLDFCTISHNIRHKLIVSGRKIIDDLKEDSEDKEQYRKIYSSRKTENDYKQLIIKDVGTSVSISENDAIANNRAWCKKNLVFYADESLDTEAYTRALKWCVYNDTVQK